MIIVKATHCSRKLIHTSIIDKHQHMHFFTFKTVLV